MKTQLINILLVEDNLGDAELLEEILEEAKKSHLELTHVSSLGVAESCLSSAEFDVVLLDLSLPDSQGIDTITSLLSFDPNLPIVVLTGCDDEELAIEAVRAGAQDYLVKGQVETNTLVRAIRYAIERKQLAIQAAVQTKHIASLLEKLETANQELQRLATLDGLTQLANRRRFDEYLESEWRRLIREQAPLSLILCDIDFFKVYNDAYGHLAGDECLRRVAQVLKQAGKRSTDLIARYGGEEFAVILPNTPAIGAVQVAEEIRTGVLALKIPQGNRIENAIAPLLPSRYVTLSLGVASTIPKIEASAKTLIEAADKALYQAKQQGRDRIVLYQN